MMMVRLMPNAIIWENEGLLKARRTFVQPPRPATVHVFLFKELTNHSKPNTPRAPGRPFVKTKMLMVGTTGSNCRT